MGEILANSEKNIFLYLFEGFMQKKVQKIEYCGIGKRAANKP